MNDKIKETYKQLDHKGEIKRAAAEKFGVNESTISSHWLSGGNIPLKDQKEFLKFLKSALRAQRSYLNKLKQ